MNKKKWILTAIICILSIIIGIIVSIKYKEPFMLYLGIGFDVILILVLFWKIILPDWLNK